jgi:hypothetical protein
LKKTENDLGSWVLVDAAPNARKVQGRGKVLLAWAQFLELGAWFLKFWAPIYVKKNVHIHFFFIFRIVAGWMSGLC